MSHWSFRAHSNLTLSLACCVLAVTATCGFGNSGGGQTGAAGTPPATGSAGAGGPGTAGSTGAAGTTTGAAGATGAAGTTTGAAGTTTGAAGTSGWKNYEVTASMPKAPVAIAQKPGQLKYTKLVIQDQFLAESCSIGDYNGDGIPDVSAGRTWYEGTNDLTTTFKTQHNFRDGHGALPRAGAGPELNTGVSDDWADYPWDMDGDGDTDIVNIAQCDVPESNSPTAGSP